MFSTSRAVGPRAASPSSSKCATQSEWIPVGRGSTDNNGRLTSLTPEGHPLLLGTYRLTFDTGTYHRAQGIASPFFPEVKIFFNVDGAGESLPSSRCCLSPYGYSTYRGS